MSRVTLYAVFLMFITTPAVSADVLYCISDETMGFEPQENYKDYEYGDRRFKLRVDFETEEMFSEKIYLMHGVDCIRSRDTFIV